VVLPQEVEIPSDRRPDAVARFEHGEENTSCGRSNSSARRIGHGVCSGARLEVRFGAPSVQSLVPYFVAANLLA
jgi:hypothetical protein